MRAVYDPKKKKKKAGKKPVPRPAPSSRPGGRSGLNPLPPLEERLAAATRYTRS